MKKTCRVTVNQNKSPGSDIKRSPTGKDLAFYDLPAVMRGKEFYREYFPDAKLAVLSTKPSTEKKDQRGKITVKENGQTKFICRDAEIPVLAKGDLRTCSLDLRVDEEGIFCAIDVSPVFQGRAKRSA